MSTTENDVRAISVRVPIEIYEWIQDLAKKEKRSINSQFVVILESIMDSNKSKDIQSTYPHKPSSAGAPPHHA